MNIYSDPKVRSLILNTGVLGVSLTHPTTLTETHGLTGSPPHKEVSSA